MEGIAENRVRTVNPLSSPIRCIFRIQWIDEDSGIKTESYRTSFNSSFIQLPEALKHSLLENFQIEGIVPITRHEMQEMMRLSIDDLKKTIENSLISIALRNSSTANVVNASMPDQVHDLTHYTTWNWNGRLHPVPENFEFPV